MTTKELDEAVAIVRHISALRRARERCARATQIRVVGDLEYGPYPSASADVDLSPSEGAVFASAFDALLEKCADRLQALGVNDPKE